MTGKPCLSNNGVKNKPLFFVVKYKTKEKHLRKGQSRRKETADASNGKNAESAGSPSATFGIPIAATLSRIKVPSGKNPFSRNVFSGINGKETDSIS